MDTNNTDSRCFLECSDEKLWEILLDINSLLKSRDDKLLEDRRDWLRSLLQDRARPNLRPLKILDLPDELLMHIFKDVRGEFPDPRWQTCPPNDPVGFKTIPNIRLCCRRFCDTSSHLLLHRVHIGLTPQSLVRIHEIAHHPTISKGVKGIQLHLGPFYDPILAYELPTFISFRIAKLDICREAWQRHYIWNLLGDTSFEHVEAAISKATFLIKAWRTLIDRGIDTTDSDHLMILRAHQRYQQLYEDHITVCEHLLVAMASAMKQMPTATWLTIDEADTWDQLDDVNSAVFFPLELDQPEMVFRTLVSPMIWMDAREFGLETPFKFFSGLLTAFQRCDAPLKNINIITPPPDISQSARRWACDPNTLAAATKQLESIRFNPPGNANHARWAERPAADWIEFNSFISTFIHTESLENIELGFRFILIDWVSPPRISMASLLLSHKWPRLKRLQFIGPFYFREIVAVVGPLGRHVEIEWSGYLMDGSWVDVLDFFRERGSQKQLVGDVDVSCFGQECEEMTRKEKLFIFQNEPFRSKLSRATSYIMGAPENNPVRDWQTGEIDMPDSVIDVESVEDDEDVVEPIEDAAAATEPVTDEVEAN